jgi:C-terminal processing protease CtpA/Prc
LFFTLVALGIPNVSRGEQAANPAPDYAAVVTAINETLRAYHYDPSELDSSEYRRIEEAVVALGDSVDSDEALLDGFRSIWKDGPFSHVTLNKSPQTAAEMADYVDTMRVGGGGATLAWQEDVAVLTVKTMMGLDTIEEIAAAYADIAANGASALIIDLRENGGGAFAVRPLVSHLLAEPCDAGLFVSQPWNAAEARVPNRSDLASVEPWEGWSVKAFWADVQVNPLTRISFAPTGPRFDGPVYVLTSKWTASAAELAADALKSAGRATLIGETTAGEMLSQKMYDLPGGFLLSLPIADYYSMTSGRIEGRGVKPDIEVDAAGAMDMALQQIRMARQASR